MIGAAIWGMKAAISAIGGVLALLLAAPLKPIWTAGTLAGMH